MADLDRTVGGLRCRDVLALLDGFVDDALGPAQLDRVHRHLAGCDTCEKFGGEYAALVQRLRAESTAAAAEADTDSGAEAGADVRARLAARMDRYWDESA